jgi:hypothetical protein
MSSDIYSVKSRSDGGTPLSTFWMPAHSPGEQGRSRAVDIFIDVTDTLKDICLAVPGGGGS